MFHLYVKTHNITGLKYLGQTTKNPYTYPGSGLIWGRHLSKHGKDVTTEVIGSYDTKEQLKAAGLTHSIQWDIVRSKDWANLREEAGTGYDGGRVYHHLSDPKYRTIPKKKRNIRLPKI